MQKKKSLFTDVQENLMMYLLDLLILLSVLCHQSLPHLANKLLIGQTKRENSAYTIHMSPFRGSTNWILLP